jgi:uridine kinase
VPLGPERCRGQEQAGNNEVADAHGCNLGRLPTGRKPSKLGAMLHRPLLIGVVGGSGSGKTTVARAIYDFLGMDAAFVDQDAYYKDLAHLPLEERRLVNFDHPDAFDTDLLVEQLTQLQQGRSVRKPTYDILVDGILLFADARLRTLFDIKIFVDVADDVRFIRRLQRDVTERGRTMDDVVRQYLTTVRPMHLEFVEPSKRYADLILPEGGHNRIGVETILARVELELSRRRVGSRTAQSAGRSSQGAGRTSRKK